MARQSELDELRKRIDGDHPVKLLLTYVEEREGVPHICIPDGHGYPVIAEAMTTATRG